MKSGVEHGNELRINRNIVECKCAYLNIPIISLTELIETLWNVNVIIDKHDCVVAGN